MPAKSPATTKPAPKAPAKTTAVAAKTEARPKAAGKTAASVKPAKGSKPLNGLQKPLKPSKDLAVIVGDGALPRAEVVSKIWAYIKANNLQNRRTGGRSSPTTSCGKCSAKTRSRCLR